MCFDVWWSVVQVLQQIKMLKGQRMQFNQFYEGLNESISYDDGQNYNYNQTAPPNTLKTKAFRLSTLPSLTINNISQTLSMEEQSLQTSMKVFNRFKCFRCFGLKDKMLPSSRNNQHEQNCPECNGSEYITQDNGIASLFQKVIQSKYPHLLRTKEATKKSPLSKLGTAKSIEQQSSPLMQNNKDQCFSCNQSLQTHLTYICQSCPYFNICLNCYINRKYLHQNQHKITYKQPKESLRITQKFFLNSNMKKISQEFQPLEMSNNLQQNLQLQCHNCLELIQECYQSCLNCQKQGLAYIICDRCSQSGQYDHYLSHELAMKTAPQLSKLNKLYSKSDTFAVENPQPIKDHVKFELKVKAVNSIVGVELDQSCNLQSEEMNSNIHFKDSSLMRMFPIMDKSYGQSQESYENKKSDVTQYDLYKMPLYQQQPFNLHLFTTPRKSISPIKNQLDSRDSTQVTRSPKTSIEKYINSNKQLENKGQNQAEKTNPRFSTIRIDLQGSIDYSNNTIPYIQVYSPLKKQVKQMQKSKINIDLGSSLDYEFATKVEIKQQSPKNSYFRSKTNIFSEFQTPNNQQKVIKPVQRLNKNIYIPSYIQDKAEQRFSSFGQPQFTQSCIQPSENTCIYQASDNNSMNTSFHQNIFEQYIFDYRCDLCNSDQPIKNVRFKCQQCKDFDLCEQCHLYRKSQHHHTEFQEINGRQILQNMIRTSIMRTDNSIRPNNDKVRKNMIDIGETSFSSRANK